MQCSIALQVAVVSLIFRRHPWQCPVVVMFPNPAVAHPDKSQAYFNTVEEAKVPQGKVVTPSSPAEIEAAIASKAPTAVYYYKQSCGKCTLVRRVRVFFLLSCQHLVSVRDCVYVDDCARVCMCVCVRAAGSVRRGPL
jgi:hypothetical protein